MVIAPGGGLLGMLRTAANVVKLNLPGSQPEQQVRCSACMCSAASCCLAACAAARPGYLPLPLLLYLSPLSIQLIHLLAKHAAACNNRQLAAATQAARQAAYTDQDLGTATVKLTDFGRAVPFRQLQQQQDAARGAAAAGAGTASTAAATDAATLLQYNPDGAVVMAQPGLRPPEVCGLLGGVCDMASACVPWNGMGPLVHASLLMRAWPSSATHPATARTHTQHRMHTS